MQFSEAVTFLTLLSLVGSQQPFFNYWNQPFYPGSYYPFTYPVQQPQYVATAAQQQYLANVAQQQKLLAMSQMPKPQHMYTSIVGAKWPKWPIYKPQYAYTNALQTFIRPQKIVSKQPISYPSFVKIPSTVAYPFVPITPKNTTKIQPITFNHILKPTVVYMPPAQNLLPSHTQPQKHLLPQPFKYHYNNQFYGGFPVLVTKKPAPAIIKPTNIPAIQMPTVQTTKETVVKYQIPKTALNSIQPSLINSLTLPQPIMNNPKPLKSTVMVQNPKNILTLQTPSKLVLTSTSMHKNVANSQTTSTPSNVIKNQQNSASVVMNTPKPMYSTFLGQSLVRNEPSYINQLANPTPSRTILMPVKNEAEKGPIYTIPAPNLSLGDKPKTYSNYNPAVQQFPVYNYQATKTPSYEVTEPSAEKPMQEQQSFKYSPQYPSQPSASVFQPSSAFMPMISNAQPHQSQPASEPLTSQEFYDLLNSVTPEHPGTFNIPNFSYQPSSVNAPLQPFNAIIQPVYSNKENMFDNMLFKTGQKYTQKPKDQYTNSMNNVPTKYQAQNIQDNMKDNNDYQSDLVSFVNQHDSSNMHYNIIRNTDESSAVTNDNQITSKDVKNINHLTANDKEKTQFLPTVAPETNKDLTISKPAIASYFTQVSIPDNSISNSISKYFPPLTEKEVDDTLATIQVASTLMQSHVGNRPTNSFTPSNYQQFLDQNVPSSNVHIQFLSNSNDQFKPIKTSPKPPQSASDDSDQELSENRGPIRIFVPDNYDDIDSDPIDAQESAQNNNVEDYGNDVGLSKRSEFVDYSQISGDRKNDTKNEIPRKADHTTASSEVSTQDVIVLLQRNNTDPALDIVTKDWKTSIVIKSKDKKESSTSLPEPEPLNEDFGSRLRPKRQK